MYVYRLPTVRLEYARLGKSDCSRFSSLLLYSLPRLTDARRRRRRQRRPSHVHTLARLHRSRPASTRRLGLSLCGLFLSPQSPSPPSATWMCRETSRPRRPPRLRRPAEAEAEAEAEWKIDCLAVAKSDYASEKQFEGTRERLGKHRKKRFLASSFSSSSSPHSAVLTSAHSLLYTRLLETTGSVAPFTPRLSFSCSSSVLSSQSSATRHTRHAYSVLCTG